MKEPKPVLPPAELKLLQTRDFSQNPPGTILRDFDALLDFIGAGRVPLTPAHLLAMGQLEPINQRLSKPLQMRLKRPVQKSYPPINGLYLLLRASGIGCVDTRQKTPALLADPDLVNAWRALNSAERYFELLKAWWGRADEHVIGERGGLAGDFLFKSVWFLDDLLKTGSKRYAAPQEADGLRYHPGLHNLALMELFGFLTLELMPPESGGAWLPSALRLTDWGRMLLAGYLDFCRKDLATEDDAEWGLDPKRFFERWSRLVLPHVKEWRRGLDIPEPAFQPGPHIFKVFLGKRCWRRIAAPGNCLLSQFADDILYAFDFNHDHLYSFSYQNRFGASLEINHPYMEGDGEPADTVQLGDLPLTEGMHIGFLFDFGANWEFDIVVETVNAELSLEATEVLEKRGDPPEQYGH